MAHRYRSTSAAPLSARAFLLACFVASSVPALAATRYVNGATGADAGGCTSAGAPCRTITYAMAQAAAGAPGDLVSVAAGTYNTALGETFPIVVKSGVQLVGAGAASTILDASNAENRVLETAATAHPLTVIEGFTIRGGSHTGTNSLTDGMGGGLLISGGSPRIRRNVFESNGAGGFSPLFGGPGSAAYGGAIYASGAPRIENNVFRNNIAVGGTGGSPPTFGTGGAGANGQGGAIYISGGGEIVNNTFYDNKVYGGSGGYGSLGSGSPGSGYGGGLHSTGASVVNNIFANNYATHGISTGAMGTTFGDANYAGLYFSAAPSATKNLFYANFASGRVDGGDVIGSNAITNVNPRFHSAPHALGVLNTSVAKAAGTTSGAPFTDLLGTTRPSPPTIGAYEAADPVYQLVLEGNQQASPYVATTASGSGTASYNSTTRQLTFNLSYSGLTGSESGAHVHGPAVREANAGVLHTLSFSNPKTDTVTLTAQQETYLLSRQLYVNIHTTVFPSGQLRAQIDAAGAAPTFALSVTKSVHGTGVVTGTTEAGTVINCGSDCSETIPQNKTVALSATATNGSTFIGWGGACAGTGSCDLTMITARNVTATFDPPVTNSSAQLVLTQTATPSAQGTGKDVVFRLVVVNQGPAAASNIVLTNPIPAGATYVWASPGCSLAAGTVTCNHASLANGAGTAFKVVLRRATAGALTNAASVVAAEPDPTSANNSVSTAVNVTSSPAASQVLRYRLYSDISKEHHFTTDLNEYNTLGAQTGVWVQEGSVGKVLNNPGSFSGVAATPYYRLYDNNTRWHHWTTDPNEYYTLIEFPWWSAEGVDGYILPTQAAGTIPLYRLLYPFIGGLHHWTIDTNEYNVLTTQYGWIGEGGSGYVIP